MFNDDGLACKSHGKGTPAKQLIYDAAGERQWAFREFDGIPGCIANKCPDYIAKKCKPHGNMKCFPSIDLAPNPYRFETTSVNTIVGIESALSKLWHLLAAAHTVKSLESGKDIPFEGFFGMKLFLVHKKIKSGGRDVFITDLLPSKEFTQIVMEPIKRGILKNVSAAKLAGGAGSVSLLSDAAQKLIQSSEVLDEFAEDADLSAPPSEEEIVDQAAEALTEK